MNCNPCCCALGSPPRMRGILQHCEKCGYVHRITPAHAGYVHRITPAHAGNTDKLASTPILAGDHPRACGEYPMRRIRFPWRLGSPPRMRGILFCFTVSLLPCGITPAHAGNTSPRRRTSRRIWDHPRACGEYLIAFVAK